MIIMDLVNLPFQMSLLTTLLIGSSHSLVDSAYLAMQEFVLLEFTVVLVHYLHSIVLLKILEQIHQIELYQLDSLVLLMSLRLKSLMVLDLLLLQRREQKEYFVILVFLHHKFHSMQILQLVIFLMKLFQNSYKRDYLKSTH